MEVKGIKYISPAFDSSGYAKASRGYILALHRLGVPITLSPISFEGWEKADLGEDGRILRSLVGKQIDYNVVVIHTTPEFWSKHKESGKTNVGYTIWETDRLHPDWPGFINNNVQKVLVGCEWNVGVFKKSGVKIPVGVVQHGIYIEDFEDIAPYNVAGVNEDTFMFYDIFQWTERKHPFAMLKAYYYEFKPEDNVALVLKTYRGDYSKVEKDAIRDSVKRLKSVMPRDYYANVFLVLDQLSEPQIHGLHARGDCFVSLNRGEGFGLCPFTAGAFGNPVVITGFGGQTEYAKDDTAYLVDYSLAPVHGMPWNPWYRGDQLWANPDHMHAAKHMRYVYENQVAAKTKGVKLRKYILDNFTWDKVGQKMLNEIEEL